MNTDTAKEELNAAQRNIVEAACTRVQAEIARYEAWKIARREKLIAEETARRQPGILDRIQTCESREAAHLMWHEFLDTANAVSQKTINKANRLLETLDFPLP